MRNVHKKITIPEDENQTDNLSENTLDNHLISDEISYTDLPEGALSECYEQFNSIRRTIHLTSNGGAVNNVLYLLSLYHVSPKIINNEEYKWKEKLLLNLDGACSEQAEFSVKKKLITHVLNQISALPEKVYYQLIIQICALQHIPDGIKTILLRHILDPNSNFSEITIRNDLIGLTTVFVNNSHLFRKTNDDVIKLFFDRCVTLSKVDYDNEHSYDTFFSHQELTSDIKGYLDFLEKMNISFSQEIQTGYSSYRLIIASLLTFMYAEEKINKNGFEKIKDDLIKSFELQLDSKQESCPIHINNGISCDNYKELINNLFSYKLLEKTIKKYGLFNQSGFKDITIISESEKMDLLRNPSQSLLSQNSDR
jgi:hypothetical protein